MSHSMYYLSPVLRLSLESFNSCCFCIPAKYSFQHFPVFSYACNWDVMFATAPSSLSYHSLFLPPVNLGRKNQKRQIFRWLQDHVWTYHPIYASTINDMLQSLLIGADILILTYVPICQQSANSTAILSRSTSYFSLSSITKRGKNDPYHIQLQPRPPINLLSITIIVFFCGERYGQVPLLWSFSLDTGTIRTGLTMLPGPVIVS